MCQTVEEKEEEKEEQDSFTEKEIQGAQPRMDTSETWPEGMKLDRQSEKPHTGLLPLRNNPTVISGAKTLLTVEPKNPRPFTEAVFLKGQNIECRLSLMSLEIVGEQA